MGTLSQKLFLSGLIFLFLTGTVSANWAETLDERLDPLAKPILLYEDQVKIKFGAESRYRLELRNNFNFNDATSEDDAVNLLRNRLSADLTLSSFLRIFAEGQDAESFAQSGLNKTNAFIDRLELHELYGELKSPWNKVPLSVTVGRQGLSYGDRRFVGYSVWSNVSALYDAVKAVFVPTAWFQVDTWFSRRVLVTRTRLNSSDHADNFYGIYTVLKPLTDHVLDTFLFIRHNRNNEIAGEKRGEFGQLKEYTVGNRFKGKKYNFDYGIEWARQFGSRAHDDIKAWAWHNDLGYTFSFLPGSPHLNFEYNHGSGDDDPRDGDAQNFDNLFPSNHSKYGYMDFVSLRNIHDFKLGNVLKLTKSLKLTTDYHWFFLDTNSSAWFNSSQAVVQSAKSGASTTLGQELDLLAIWQMSKHLEFWIGYSHFHAGAFVKDTGAHDNADFFYTQIAVKV